MQLPLEMLSQSGHGCSSWIFFIALSIFYLLPGLCIANVVWQLVHYTVYGTPKSDNDTIQYLYNNVYVMLFHPLVSTIWARTDQNGTFFDNNGPPS